MFTDITSIELSGANFSERTQLSFFGGNNDNIIKGSLVYGRNGTGKSTIARAFRVISGKESPVITYASIYDKNNKQIVLSEEEKKHIHVYDEEYVNENVRLREDHLETIIMLGKAADLSKKIEEAEKEKAAAEAIYKKQEKRFQEFQKETNPISPFYYLDAMANDLKGDDNWAGRDREIKKSRMNTSVNRETYKRFIDLKPQKNKTDLLMDYRNNLLILKESESANSTIREKVPGMPESYLKYDDSLIKRLLALKIEKPELSEREQKLLSIKTDELSNHLEFFRDEDKKECPFCFQPLSSDYKKSIIASIEKVLNKAVEDHKKDLIKCVCNTVSFIFEPFKKLKSYQACVETAEKLNNAIAINNDIINKKIGNLFEPISVESSVSALISQFKKALETMEQERLVYNETMMKTDIIKETLIRINNEIAYYDIKGHYEQLKKQEEEYSKAKKQFDDSKRDFDNKGRYVEELNAQRKSIKPAVDAINACLKYIFFSDERLKIECDGEYYKLLSRGKSVKPCDISVGERNIIGLSYFFTSLFEGKDEKDACKDEYLIVIDDPVSSFDTENRIGILSFLNYKLSSFSEGNLNTKTLVMTHDLMAFYDMYKMMKGITKTCKEIFHLKKICFNAFEIKNKTIVEHGDFRQEYTELIHDIYDYACDRNDAGQYNAFIGNMMRQVLEAFSTFVYRKGIEEVCTNSKVLELLKDSKYESYFRNLMCRLVLNGGSHRKEQVQSMRDFHFFELISTEEKKRTAKDILCFIFLLNERHILEHLEEHDDNAAAILKGWCEEIKNNTAIPE